MSQLLPSQMMMMMMIRLGQIQIRQNASAKEREK
jgi:hypothetical protein